MKNLVLIIIGTIFLRINNTWLFVYFYYKYNYICITNIKRRTIMAKLLHDETFFVIGISLWLEGNLPNQEEIEQLFNLVDGCNRYMARTTKAIKKGRVSLDGFTVQDKLIFSKLYESEKLDMELGRQLREEIEKGMK